MWHIGITNATKCEHAFVCKQLGATEQTYYRWRKEYGGLRVDQAKRMRNLQKENARLKKLVAEQALDNDVLRKAHKHHVWTYDFVMDQTHDGRPLRILTVIDEYSRECLAIEEARKLNHPDILDRLADLFVRKGVPDFIRSDNGSEFTADAARDWLRRVGLKTAYIQPRSPWANGFNESFKRVF